VAFVGEIPLSSCICLALMCNSALLSRIMKFRVPLQSSIEGVLSKCLSSHAWNLDASDSPMTINLN